MSEAQALDPSSSVSPVSTTLEGPALHRMVVRAVAASAVGTTIEWYDFFLYGVAAATVFPRMFFPQSDPFIGTLLSFSTYFVGFVARPMGAAIFGHYGDRVGRKALLVITMMMMGVATVGIGLVPSYATIGIWGAVLLTVLRLIQGLSIGGEWSGSVLMAGEWTDPKRRGFTTSFAQFGAPAGMVLANGALALMTVATTEEQFLNWGWRIPFLASIVLVFVGMYIRLGILETPVFARLKARGAVAKAPVIEVLRKNWREVVLTALLRSGQQVPFYIFTTYIITYATQQLGFSRSTILNFVIVQSLISDGDDPADGPLVRHLRTAHDHGDRLRRDDDLPVPLFRDARQRVAHLGVPGDRDRAAAPRLAVRAAGGVHFRELPRFAALQRVIARVPARLDHRGRAGPDRRRAAPPPVRHVHGHRRVHVGLRAHQPGLRVRAARPRRKPGSSIVVHASRFSLLGSFSLFGVPLTGHCSAA